MKVKFLHTVIASFGTFESDETYNLTEEQYEYLFGLVPDEISKVVDSDENQ